LIADSSFLVALFYDADSLYPRAMRDLESLTGPHIIADRVLEETFTALCYKIGAREAQLSIQKIRANKQFSILTLNEVDIRLAWALAEKVEKKFSFVDCVVITLCRQMKQPPLSYDQAMVKAVEKESPVPSDKL
jgi:predicted nucleic acid-binding protein